MTGSSREGLGRVRVLGDFHADAGGLRDFGWVLGMSDRVEMAEEVWARMEAKLREVDVRNDRLEKLEARLAAYDLKHKSDDLLVSKETISAYERVEAAAWPMARLPFPVSSDERDDWRVYQQKLVAALSALQAVEDQRLGDTDSS